MKIGIFGGPGSGKSTLLNVLVAQFGYEVNDARGRKGLFVVSVPDERVDHLAGIFKPKKKVYETITLVEIHSVSDDIVDSQNISTLRECDLLLLLIPLFQSGISGGVSPSTSAFEYFREIETELILADYMVTQKRLERLEKEGKKTRELNLIKEVVSNLESGRPMREIELRQEEKKMISGFSLISEIPIIVVVNVVENDIQKDPVIREIEKIKGHGVDAFLVCAMLEEEILRLDPDDREIFMRDAGLDGFIGEEIVKSASRLLNRISFLTFNPNEVRAWSVKNGTPVREAAGKVHSDMERGFIRAEVIHFEDFVQFNDMSKAKGAGKVRLEGKDYVVKDGDIVTVRFNV